MTSNPQHLTHFEGGNALPDFRARSLLARLQAVAPRVTAVAARHVHWVVSASELSRAEHDTLAALLRYGDAYAGPAEGMLKRAIQFDPNNKSAHYILGQTYQLSGRTEEAAREFAIAEKLQGVSDKP